MRFHSPVAAFAVAAISLAACGGGGGGAASVPATTPVIPTSAPTTAPTTAATSAPTTAPTAAPQVIKIALPTGTMGTLSDPVYGAIGGYTQSSSSQVLGFVPGAQVMLQNIASGTPHTLGVIGQAGFSAAPSLGSAAPGSTIGAGFATGAIGAGQLVGPFSLAQGTYYFGCNFHYATSNMRDVIIVQPGAAPGPQATPVPVPTGSNPPPCPGGYC